MPRNDSNTRAFTTMELLVVVVIVILLASISLTSLAGRRGRGDAVSAESRKIERLLATARSYALARNGYFQAVIWIDQPSYWIDETDKDGVVLPPTTDGSGNKIPGGAKVVTPEPLDEIVLIPEVKVNSDSPVKPTGKVAIRFFPQGNSDNASIYLIRRGADQADTSLYTTVKLYGPTGRVNVLKNQKP